MNHILLENGSQPPKSQHIYQYKDGYIRFVQNRDYESENHITYIPISKKNHLCNDKDIMMDKYGDAGAVRFGINGAFNVALLKIIPINDFEKEFIRDFLMQPSVKNSLYLSSQASTRPSLNETTFTGLKVPVIPIDSLKKYEHSMSQLLNLYNKIKNDIENYKKIKMVLLEKYF